MTKKQALGLARMLLADAALYRTQGKRKAHAFALARYRAVMCNIRMGWGIYPA